MPKPDGGEIFICSEDGFTGVLKKSSECCSAGGESPVTS